jgi:hypothetical protein
MSEFDYKAELDAVQNVLRILSEFDDVVRDKILRTVSAFFATGQPVGDAMITLPSATQSFRRLSHLSATVMDPAMARAPASRGCGRGYTDQTDSGTTVNSIGDVLDFSQSPRSFQMIPSSCAASCIESATLPTGPPDDK